MENENNLVQIENEDGKVYNMLILKEFDYKKKKYVILSEIDVCNCGDECNCDDECDCDDDCKGDCHCKEDSDDYLLCILEVVKDKDGKETFKSIEDNKLFDEVVDYADKIIDED